MTTDKVEQEHHSREWLSEMLWSVYAARASAAVG